MRYDTPQLTALTPAIIAVQFSPGSKVPPQSHIEGNGLNDSFTAAYEDWE